MMRSVIVIINKRIYDDDEYGALRHLHHTTFNHTE